MTARRSGRPWHRDGISSTGLGSGNTTGKLYQHITDRLETFIKKQHVFFVATAPLENGHVNVSPKGQDTFAILDPHTVAYQDFSGSGAETIAHLKQNGRITIMFCAFEGPPFILRLYGQGEVLEPDNPNFDELNKCFTLDLGVRSIIRMRLTRIQDSCGYGVPLYDFVKQRDTLLKWAKRKGEQGIVKFKREYNVQSIDGLLALEIFDRPQ